MSLRWAVNIENWNPSASEFERILSYVQPEEQARIKRFHFHIDAKRALVGRLLMRTALVQTTRVSWAHIVLQRSSKGKPYWTPPSDYKASPGSCIPEFNISHHGSWVVLATELDSLIGCDIMSIELPGRNKDINRFFVDMRNCFTEHEWPVIRTQASEREQLAQFFTFWTLKEAFVKAIGVGIGFDLQRVEFYRESPPETRADKVESKSCPFFLRVHAASLPGHLGDGGMAEGPRTPPVLQPEWRLELTQLDQDHLVAVALGPRGWTLEGSARPPLTSYSLGPSGILTATEHKPCTAPVAEIPMRRFEVKTVAELLRLGAACALESNNSNNNTTNNNKNRGSAGGVEKVAAVSTYLINNTRVTTRGERFMEDFC
jgi:4'-phosphopantetheinyl transferase